MINDTTKKKIDKIVKNFVDTEQNFEKIVQNSTQLTIDKTKKYVQALKDSNVFDTWVKIAMNRVVTEKLDDDTFIARVKVLHGVVGSGKSEKEAIDSLETQLYSWLKYKLLAGETIPKVVKKK